MKFNKFSQLHWTKILTIGFSVFVLVIPTNIFAKSLDPIQDSWTTLNSLVVSVEEKFNSVSSDIFNGWEVPTYSTLDNEKDTFKPTKKATTQTTSVLNSISNLNSQLIASAFTSLESFTKAGSNAFSSISFGFADSWNLFIEGIVDGSEEFFSNTKDAFNKTKTFVNSINSKPKVTTKPPSIPVSPSKSKTVVPPLQDQTEEQVPTIQKDVTKILVPKTTIKRITETPNITVINKVDEALLLRILGLEKAVQNNSSFNSRQTIRVYESVGDSINNTYINITEDGILNDSTLNRPIISSATITGSSFSGTSGVYSGDVSALTVTTPMVIGGSATTQDLSFKTTTGIGESGADMHFLVGNNGATEAMTILNSGYVGIGTTTPGYPLEVSGKSYLGGHVGIGNSNSLPGDYTILAVDDTYTLDAAGNFYGAKLGQRAGRITSAFTGYSWGAFVSTVVNSTNTQDWSGDGVHTPLVGTWSKISSLVGATGTISEGASIVTSTDWNGSGVLTNRYGLRVMDATGVGTITNQYGLYIDNMTKGSALDYSIYSVGGLNYFGGNVGIGIADPGVYKLNVAGIINSLSTSATSFSSTGATTGGTLMDLRNTGGNTYVGVESSAGASQVAGSSAYSSYLTSVNATALHLGTDATVRLTILPTSGNVGIGTTVPAQKLDVSGKIALDGVVVAYRPTAMTGTLIFGNGGTNLSHTAGNEGYYNTFVGIDSGNANTTGYGNTTNGYGSFYNNTTGYGNVANGTYSLRSNTEGAFNTANGYETLYWNTTGSRNTADGHGALVGNTTGSYNTAIGFNSGRYIADGGTKNETSTYSVYLGGTAYPLADGDIDEIVIGYGAIGAGSHSVTLGATTITKTILRSNVGIGTTAPAGKLTIHEAGSVAYGNEAIILTDANVAHGMTGWYPTTVYGAITSAEPDKGGLNISGFSDDASISGLTINGFIGVADPTDTISAVTINGGRANGTGQGALGALETVFQIKNAGTNQLTILGSGNVGIGTTTPSEKLSVYDSGTTAATVATFYRNVTDGLGVDMFVGKSAAIGGTGIIKTFPNIATPASARMTLGIWGDNLDTGTGLTILKTGYIGIGTTAPGYKLHILGTAGDQLQLESTSADEYGAYFDMHHNSASPAINDYISNIRFYGEDSVGNKQEYGRIRADIVSATSGAESGRIHFQTFSAGSTVDTMSLNAGNVGIGTTSPTEILSLGNSAARKFWIENTATDVVGRALTIAAGSTIAGTSVSDVIGGNLILQSGLGTGTGDSSISFQTGTTLTTGLTLQTMSTKMTILGSGNVGIGITAPTAPLHISLTGSGDGYGNIAKLSRVGEASLWVQSIGSTYASLMTDQSLNFITGATLATTDSRTDNVRMRITSAGLVGIGTTGPVAKLDVLGTQTTLIDTAARRGILNLRDDTAYATNVGGAITFGGKINATAYYNFAGIKGGKYEASVDVAGGYLAFYVSPDSGVLEEKMRIAYGGNVGIGTTNPLGLLQVGDGSASLNPRLRIVGGTDAGKGPALTLIKGSTTIGGVYSTSAITGAGTSGDITMFAETGNALNFATNGDTTPDMTIATTGNVGIGTTNPGYKLHVNGTTSVARIQGTATSAATPILYVDDSNSDLEIYGTTGVMNIGTYSDHAIAFVGNAGTETRMYLKEDGYVGIGTTTPLSMLHIKPSASTLIGHLATAGLHIQTTDDVGRLGQMVFGYSVGSTYGSAAMGGITEVSDGNTAGGLFFATRALFTDSAPIERMRITNTGNVGIGTTTPSGLLELRTPYSTQPNFTMSSALGSTHGMTGWLPTDAFLRVQYISGDTGGANFIGASSGAGTSGLQAYGIIGVTDPTDSTPAIMLAGAKKNTTTPQALADAETVLQIRNYSTNLVTVLGNGNVGIGTTAPQTKLHVVGNYRQGFSTDTTNYYFQLAERDTGVGSVDWDFKTEDLAGGAKTIMSFDSSTGNVGIGTTTPAEKLVTNGAIVSTGAFTTGVTASLGLSWESTYGMLLGYGPDASTLAGFKLVLREGDAGSSNTPFEVAVNQNIYLAQSLGNVGIGTTAPTISKLHIESPSLTAYNLSLDDSTALAINTGGEIVMRAVSGAGGSIDNVAGIFGRRENATNNNYAGYLSFLTETAAGSLTEKMRITNDGNVGIGTTTPGTKLDIADSSGSGSTIIRLYDEAGSANAIRNIDWYNNNTDGIPNNLTYARISATYGSSYINPYLALSVSDSSKVLQERMRIDKSGNVGIGTVAPGAKLDIADNTDADLNISTYNASNSTGIRLQRARGTAASPTIVSDGDNLGALIFKGHSGSLFYSAASINGIVNGTPGASNDMPGALTFSTTPDDAADVVERMRITSSGNVGIGTTVPANKLDVINIATVSNVTPATYGGTIKITDYGINGATAVGGLEFRDSDGYGSKIYTNYDNNYLGIASRYGSATWSEHLVVKQQTGNVGIGTTSPQYAKLVLENASYHSGNNSSLAIGRATSLPSSAADYGNIYLFSTDSLAADKGGTISFGATYTNAGIRDSRVAGIFGGKTNATSDDFAGYLAFYTRTNGAFPAERMRIDNLGNVGIGTTTPGQRLHVYDTGAVTLAQFGGSGGTAGYFGSVNTATNGFTTSSALDMMIRGEGSNILFGFSTAEKVRITSTGNVGIGTTGPNGKLNIKGASSIPTAQTYNGLLVLDSSDGTTSLQIGNNASGTGSSGSWIQSFNEPATGAGNYSLLLNPLGGNVGIGTTAPTNALSFGNSADRKIWVENTAAGTAGKYLAIAAGGTVAGSADIAGGALYLASGPGTGTGASPIYFQTATTLTTGTTLQTHSTKMTILGSGNVGIGTTNPTTKLSIYDSGSSVSALNISSATGGGNVELSGGGGSAQLQLMGVSKYANIGMAVPGTSLGEDLIFSTYSPWTARMVIKNDGNVGIGTTAPGDKLAVSGSAASWTGISGLQFVETNTNVAARNFGIYNGGSGYGHLDFYVGSAQGVTSSNGTALMTILSTGYVGIGTTAPAVQFHQLLASAANDTLTNTARFSAGADGTLGSLNLNIFHYPSATAGSRYIKIQAQDSTGYRNLVFNIDGGNVGIGTTSPYTKLEVEVASNSSAALFGSSTEGVLLQDSGSSGGIIGFDGSGYNALDIRAQATEGSQLYLDTTGKIGIGTTAPSSKLTVNAESTASSYPIRAYGLVDANSEVVMMQVGPDANFDTNSKAAGFGYLHNTVAASRAAFISVGGDDPAAGTGLFVKSGGNVGIGTTAPGRKLTIASDDQTGTMNTGTAVMRLVNTDDNAANSRFAGIQFNYLSDVDAQTVGAIGTVLTDTSTQWAGDMVFGVKAATSSTTLTEYMRLEVGGNVGIGTADPGYKLDVAGVIHSGSTGETSFSATGATTGGTLINLHNTGGNTYVGVSSSAGGNQMTGSLAYSSYLTSVNATALHLGTDATARLTILPTSGNVGIGITNPSALLHMNGANAVVNSQGNLFVGTSDSAAADLGGSLGFGGSYTGTTQTYWAQIAGRKENATAANYSGYLQFSTRLSGNNSAEHMRITSSGNIGIGFTNPQVKLEIQKNCEGCDLEALRLNNTGSTTGSGVALGFFNYGSGEARLAKITAVYNGTVNGGDLRLQPADGSSGYATGLTITTAGYVGIGITNPTYTLQVNGQPAANGYTAFTNYSDERLKENIAQLETGYLEKILLLKPSTFNYNEMTGYNEETRGRTITGFIAQELQAVFPNMVGTTKINGVDYLDTNLSALPLYLVKATQELNNKLNLAVQDIAGQIDTLEETLTSTNTMFATMELKVNDLTSLDTTIATSLGSMIKNFLADINNNVGDLYATVIHANRIESKYISVEGIEMKDSATGDYYCVIITNGAMNNLPGKCDEQPAPQVDGAPVADVQTDSSQIPSQIPGIWETTPASDSGVPESEATSPADEGTTTPPAEEPTTSTVVADETPVVETPTEAPSEPLTETPLEETPTEIVTETPSGETLTIEEVL